MTTLLEDRRLLDGFRRGDESALTEVYREYVPKVVDALRLGFSFESSGNRLRFKGFSDPLELETFVQAVFIRAFSEPARMSYDGLRPFEPYLLTIARNVVIDELRRRRSAIERLIDVDPGDRSEPVSQAPLPDEELEGNRVRRLVEDFVGSLDAHGRHYVQLRFADGLSQLAAAREMRISRMRARLLEKRVLGGLKKRLLRAGYDATCFAHILLTGLL
jgi:RNA polymerase sigma-70 factor (ECF subfamily)